MYSRLPPEPGETPTRVVFEGVEPGSAEAQRLYHERMGEISSFHQKARQNRVMSGSPGSSMQQALPNGDQLRYTFNNGIENIRVRLSPQSRSGGSTSRKTKTPTPWDMILVEMQIPDLSDTGAHIGAWIVSNDPNKPPQFATSDGFNSNGPITFAIDARPLLDPQDSTIWYGSFKIDIAGMHGVPNLEVDLYGYIDKLPPLSSMLGAWVLHQYTTPAIIRTEFDEVFLPVVVQLFNGYTRAQLDAEFPELGSIPTDDQTHSTVSSRSIPVTGGSDTVNEVGEVNILNYFKQFGGDYALTFENWNNGVPYIRREHGTQWYIVETGITPTFIPGLPHGFEHGVTYSLNGASLDSYFLPAVPPDHTQPDTMPATLSTLFFRLGDPLDEGSTFRATDATYNMSYRWESSALYPKRFPMNNIPGTATVTVLKPPKQPVPENHFGMPYLGTLKFDLDGAVAKWRPA